MGRHRNSRRRHKVVRGTGPNPRRGECSGKIAFKTEADARANMQARMEETVYINGTSLRGRPNVYHCSRCQLWHWGHSHQNERHRL